MLGILSSPSIALADNAPTLEFDATHTAERARLEKEMLRDQDTSMHSRPVSLTIEQESAAWLVFRFGCLDCLADVTVHLIYEQGEEDELRLGTELALLSTYSLTQETTLMVERPNAEWVGIRIRYAIAHDSAGRFSRQDYHWLRFHSDGKIETLEYGEYACQSGLHRCVREEDGTITELILSETELVATQFPAHLAAQEEEVQP